MATKRISELQLRSDFDATCNVPVDDTSQSWRTTGQQIRDFIAPLTTIGDLLFATTAGAAARLAIGSAQQILRPVAGVPAWAWPYAVQRTATTTDSINATTDHIVFMNASGGAFTATLPTAASAAGKTYILKKIGTDLNVVTIATTSSQTIDGVVGTALHTPNETLVIFSDGSNWQILERRTAFSLSSQAWTDSMANSTTSVQLSRKGNRIFVSGKVSVTGAFGTNLTITIPSEYTASGTHYDFAGGFFTNIGALTLRDTGSDSFQGVVLLGAATTLQLYSLSQSGATNINWNTITATAPFTWANTDGLAFDANWVVSGWND